MNDFFLELHGFVLLKCFFFKFSSEAGGVLNVLLIFWEIEPQCSYKECSHKKDCISVLCTPICTQSQYQYFGFYFSLVSFIIIWFLFRINNTKDEFRNKELIIK